jgi:hypothetical protein
MEKICNCADAAIHYEHFPNHPVYDSETNEQSYTVDIRIMLCQKCMKGKEIVQNMGTGIGYTRTGQVQAWDSIDRATKRLRFSEEPRVEKLE